MVQISDSTMAPKSNKSQLDDIPSTDMELGQITTVTSTAGNSPTLDKNFNLVSLAGIGLVTGITWPALGGSLLASISNGGAPGVLYEFIAAVLAELASALPSSSGVLLWSSVTAGKKHGRLVGYFSGWWNALAWVFAEASMSSIAGNDYLFSTLCGSKTEMVSRKSMCSALCNYSPRFRSPAMVCKRESKTRSQTSRPYNIEWNKARSETNSDTPLSNRHNFICYLIITWSSCAVVCLANSAVPRINIVGLILILVGAIVTIVVCVTMAAKRSGVASSKIVWSEWHADIGYPDGFVFVAGMLNGAFAMGTPDATSHLAEEIPRPEINVPKAMASQYILGFTSGFLYLVAILYTIEDYSAFAGAAFPIADVYRQATGSVAGAVGLLVVLLLPVLVCTIGLYVTCGRTLWTLGCIGATPASRYIGHVSSTKHMPLYATLASAGLVTVLGCVQLGSQTAFNAFINSFILHSTASYMAATVPYLFQRHHPTFPPGPFRMRGIIGWVIHIWACVYMLAWFIIYCFPVSLPTNAADVNYSSLIWFTLTMLGGLWWIFRARHTCMWPKRITERW